MSTADELPHTNTAPVISSEEMKPQSSEDSKQVTSTPAHLKLVEYKPEVYAGISPATIKSSMVVIFPEDATVMELRGDQGTTKSSQMSCIRALMGGEEVDNAINSSEGTKKAELTFTFGGRTYTTKITKTGFSVTEIQEMGAGKKAARMEVREPKTFLRNLIGPLGTDPHFIKSRSPKDQIAWMREMMPLPEGAVKLEEQIESGIKSTYSARTEANRNVKFYKQELLQTPYYEWDVKGKRLVDTPSLIADAKLFDNLEEKGKVLDKQYNERLNAKAVRERTEQKAKGQTEKIKEYETRIKELELQIMQAKKWKEEGEEELKKTNALLEENKDAEAKFEEARTMLNAHNELRIREGVYKNAIDRKKIFDGVFTNAATLDAKLAELTEQQQKFIAAITPKIPGLEICIPREVDLNYERDAFIAANQDSKPEDIDNHLKSLKKETREGIYFNGRSVTEMSESELWDMWLSLCKELKVRAVFVENVSSLGTNAIERINTLAAEGCYVFLSAMERGVKELKVTFLNTVS